MAGQCKSSVFKHLDRTRTAVPLTSAIPSAIRARRRSSEEQPLLGSNEFRDGLRMRTVHGVHLSVEQGVAQGVLSVRCRNQQNFQEGAAFVALLKTCAQQLDLKKGSSLHADILKRGLLENNMYIASALVNMYAKCGALAKAQQVFNELSTKNIVCWNALIAGYAQHRHSEEALNWFERMQQEGVSPDAVTFTCIAKACGSIRAADKGQKLHADVARAGMLDKDVSLGTALVDMYVKCKALAKAQELFDELPVRNVVCWNVLISGYSQYGHSQEVLKCFEQMQWDGPSPNAITFSCVLKACGSIGAAQKGRDLHAMIVREGMLEKNVLLGTALVDMYVKCGGLAKAQEVFDELPVRDVVSWTALIAGYTQHGNGEEALNCFERMQHEGLSPDASMFACIAKACGIIGAAKKGKEIHAEIVKAGLLEKDVLLGTALIDMYAKCGALSKAQELFDKLPARNVVSWTALIAGYAQHGHGKEALCYFEHMKGEGLSPNSVTFACILKVCGSIGAAQKGAEIHAEIVREGLLENHLLLRVALVDMYAKCRAFTKAQQVFDELAVRNVGSWYALIAGYAQHGHGDAALNCFERMQSEGLSPDAVTFACILKVCGSIGAVEKGKEIHAQLGREGLLGKNVFLGTALVDMYAKCGALEKAEQVFNELSVQDTVSWTAIIAAYTQHGHGEDALNCFEYMQYSGLSPDAVTFACVVKACGSIGAAEKGKEIHAAIVREGMLEKNVSLGPALIDMYAKCGIFAKAQEVFDELPVRDVLSWTALAACYVDFGNGGTVLDSFNKMLQEGIVPDLVAFTMVLNACSHLGLLDEGQMCFSTMRTLYHIVPTLEHYTCMVDLFGRAGHFNKALAMIKQMPYMDHLPLWSALLGACQNWEYVKLGREAFQHAIGLDEKYASAYVCMSNIYAAAGMTEDAERIEAMRVKNEAFGLM